MTLYFIGLGLGDEKDISVKGLEIVKKCKTLYLEHYTSVLQCQKEDLEKFYGKPIILADREMVEQKAEQTILKDAKTHDTAFLVVGDALCATTHFDLFLRAKSLGIPCEVVHNASIMSAIGITGLQVYKFGKTTSIPFHHQNVESPYNVLKENKSLGLHTLFLLDLDPKSGKFLSIQEAIEYLLGVEGKRGEGLIGQDTLAIGLARVGSKNQLIRAGGFSQLQDVSFGEGVQCLAIPGNMHFVEEEAVAHWK